MACPSNCERIASDHVVGHRLLHGRGRKCFLFLTFSTHFKGWGGVGHVDVPCKWHATQLKGWDGVGWGGACIDVHVNLRTRDMLLCGCR